MIDADITPAKAITNNPGKASVNNKNAGPANATNPIPLSTFGNVPIEDKPVAKLVRPPPTVGAGPTAPDATSIALSCTLSCTLSTTFSLIAPVNLPIIPLLPVNKSLIFLPKPITAFLEKSKTLKPKFVPNNNNPAISHLLQPGSHPNTDVMLCMTVVKTLRIGESTEKILCKAIQKFVKDS